MGKSFKFTDTEVAAVGALAQSSVAAWHSYSMDKIKYSMQRDELDFRRKAAGQNRVLQSGLGAINAARLQEALYSEKLAMDIENMKAISSAVNQTSAFNLDAGTSVVRDLQREAARKELYQKRDHDSRMTQLKVQTIDATRDQGVLYDPVAPSTTAPFAKVGTDALTIGEMAYGRFTNKEK